METGKQQDSKKARVDPDPLLDGWKQDTVTIDKAKLQCPVCTHALQPPIFQCAAGHLACGACHGQLADKRQGPVLQVAHPGGYSRNFPLEDVVRSTRAWCPYTFYGCYTAMAVYKVDEHYRSCPRAPCRCPEPGCAFAGSPAMLSEHLRVTLSWPVNSFDYGKVCRLQLPESKPRCLLVAKEDGRVFVVSVAALRRVSLACLRRNAAAAGPHYTCKMWATGSAAAATGKVSMVAVEMEVSSSAVAGDGGKADEAALVVRREMLHGPSKELNLKVIIDKAKVQK